jgi:hypothetical protein
MPGGSAVVALAARLLGQVTSEALRQGQSDGESQPPTPSHANPCGLPSLVELVAVLDADARKAAARLDSGLQHISGLARTTHDAHTVQSAASDTDRALLKALKLL